MSFLISRYVYNHIGECLAKFTVDKDIFEEEAGQEHMDSEHTHDCDHWSLKLKTKYLLKIHNNSMHVFECEVCKEKKSTQDDLNKHIEG